MQKEKFIIIPNKKELKLYEKYNFNNFILPLKDYSIGFDAYFDIDEINELSGKYEIIVIMNKFLHKKIDDFRNMYSEFNENIKFMIEDIGLTDIIDKNRIIMYENHIVSNYKAVNFLNSIGYSNLVINNDLTYTEIEEIIKNTSSNLYYFYISYNHLMYSRRALVSNYNKYFNLENKNEYKLIEKVSNEVLNIKEEKEGTIVKFNKIFCASKYLNYFNRINLIINFSGIDSINEKMILENYDNQELYNLIDSDYYFLEHDIKYKVGDIK